MHTAAKKHEELFKILLNPHRFALENFALHLTHFTFTLNLVTIFPITKMQNLKVFIFKILEFYLNWDCTKYVTFSLIEDIYKELRVKSKARNCHIFVSSV